MARIPVGFAIRPSSAARSAATIWLRDPIGRPGPRAMTYEVCGVDRILRNIGPFLLILGRNLITSVARARDDRRSELASSTVTGKELVGFPNIGGPLVLVRACALKALRPGQAT